MHNIFELPTFSLLASYLLQTSLAFVACVVLARLLVRPRYRCALWITFLVATATYWMFLLLTLYAPLGAAENLAHVPATAMSSRISSPVVWSVPRQWNDRVDLVFRFLVWGYLLGLALSLARLAYRRMRLRSLLRRAIPVSREIDLVLQSLSRRMRISGFRALSLPDLLTPATAYALRPVILVPEFVELYLSDAQLRDVLSHEMVHIRRRDFLWQSVIEFLNCLVFFHPATWLATKYFQRERELACDSEVVQGREEKRLPYAECLTNLARLRVKGERTWLTIDFTRSESLLSVRVRTLLGPPRRQSPRKNVLSLGAGALVLVGLAILSPHLGIVLSFAPELQAGRFTQVTATVVGRAPLPSRKPRNTHQKKVLWKLTPAEQTGSATAPSITSVSPAVLLSGAAFPQSPGNTQLPLLREESDHSAAIVFNQPPLGDLPQSGKKRRHISVPWKKVGVIAATAAITYGVMELDRDGPKE